MSLHPELPGQLVEALASEEPDDGIGLPPSRPPEFPRTLLLGHCGPPGSQGRAHLHSLIGCPRKPGAVDWMVGPTRFAHRSIKTTPSTDQQSASAMAVRLANAEASTRRRSPLAREEKRTDAIQMFLVRHGRLHAHVDRLTEGLSDEEIRTCVHSLVNPLAWLTWHVARGEDGAINLLVGDGRQALDEGWSSRLNAGRRDVGRGMTMAEVVDLGARVHLRSLLAYWTAVGERTRGVVACLRPRISMRS